MSEEVPYVVDTSTGSNLDLEDLLRSLLNCYYFESAHSDKVMGRKIYVWEMNISAFQLYSILQHATYNAFIMYV